MNQEDKMKKRDRWAWWAFAVVAAITLFILADWLAFVEFIWR